MSKSKCKHVQTFWKFFSKYLGEVGECGDCGCIVLRKEDKLLYLDKLDAEIGYLTPKRFKLLKKQFNE